MAFAVVMSEPAKRDIEEIVRFIAADDRTKAIEIFHALEAQCLALDKMPERGNIPKELGNIGITEYRELHYKPYRIIYRLYSDRVVIHCVLDGRRDMQTLLLQRLLR